MDSLIKKQFYHLFWNNPSCQNLFLLSKEELLEKKTIGNDDDSFTYYTNRIIISNAKENHIESIETIKTRSELYNIEVDNLLNQKIDTFKPIVEQFFNSKFKKSFDKLAADIEKKPLKFFARIIKILIDEDTREEKAIELLHDYGFVPKNLKSFKEIETKIGKSLIPSKENQLVNEKTINTFFDGLKFAKELYLNHSYKNLYNTNQILVNTLNSEDKFQSRMKVFSELYDHKIIGPSIDDAFIECPVCPPTNFRGVLLLRLNPKFLKNLKCPECSRELTYFVPYELHDDIYKIVKSHDGLLLDALCNKISSAGHQYDVNKNYLGDIEIDCVLKAEDKAFIIETKMYKQNTTPDKIISKIKEHFAKLIKDTERLEKIDEFKGFQLIPILLTNINNHRILSQSQQHLKNSHESKYYSIGSIINLNLFKI